MGAEAANGSDAAVIAASRTTPEAFAAIFDRHYPAVRGYVRDRHQPAAKRASRRAALGAHDRATGRGQRDVLLLFAWELSYDEIAAVLEIPVGTVRSRLARARRRLRTRLDASGRLEYQYDRALRSGFNLRLTLDPGVERVGTRALQHAIASNPPADGGAFVALNPQNGEVYGMGSLPSFDPSIFTRPISNAAYRDLSDPKGGFPLIDRAIQSAGPVGSSFTPITAAAALQSGAWSVGESFHDTGPFCEGTLCRSNAGGAAYGVVDIVSAIRRADDVFFLPRDGCAERRRDGAAADPAGPAPPAASGPDLPPDDHAGAAGGRFGAWGNLRGRVGSFPEQVYGKTGTAQYIANGTEHDYAWYAGFVPQTATSRPIAVVVTVQKGRYGAVAAAPVAREILSQWFFGKPGRYVAGSSRTR